MVYVRQWGQVFICVMSGGIWFLLFMLILRKPHGLCIYLGVFAQGSGGGTVGGIPELQSFGNGSGAIAWQMGL